MEKYQHELEVAKAAAREAGDIIMRHYARPEIDVSTKADKSPVTAADLEANAAITKHLAAAFPDEKLTPNLLLECLDVLADSGLGKR